MDVKEVFSALSENIHDIPYTSLLYENRREKILLFIAGVTFTGFIASTTFSPLLALLLATLFLVSLIFYSAISFLGSKDFITNPVRFYVEAINDDIDIENGRLGKLSRFSQETLLEAKNIFEFENQRFKSKVSLIIGAIDKVGIFPSLLALFYAFHEYSSSTGSILPAFILLGLVMGIYFGLFLIQRIISWQNYCIYLLNKATSN